MKLDSKDCLFCLIDVQEKLFAHIEDNLKLEKNLTTLIEGIKLFDLPILINEQYKKGIGTTIESLDTLVQNYPKFDKTTFSAMGNSDFAQTLQKLAKPNIIIAGTETHVCVLQTCLDLIANNYTVYLVVDCCGSRTQLDKEVAISRLTQAGVIPITYESVLFELCADKAHKNFKSMLHLVK